MAIAFDATVGARIPLGFGGTPGFTTHGPNEIVVLTINTVPNGPAPVLVSSVTDTTGLTWTRRSATSSANGWTANGNTCDTVEVWWALCPTARSGNLTITHASSIEVASVSTMSFTGVNTASPWDPSPSFPATATFASLTANATQTPSVSASTTGPRYLLGIYGSASSGNKSPSSSGWTDLNGNNGNPVTHQCTNDTFGALRSAADTNFPFVMSAEATWVMVIDALVPAPPMTASALTAPAPVFGTATINQAHGLAATALITPAHAAGAPALGQRIHVTATALIAPAPLLAIPPLGQAHGLAATALTAPAPRLDPPALAAAYTLLASPLAAPAPLLGSPSLIVPINAELTAINLVVTRPVFSPAALRQRHALFATDLRAAPWHYAFRPALSRRIIGSADLNRIEGRP